ncbi:hypothetical protein [Oerskovia rustica]|uniref:Lipoprotein n=1 Tax=Oerskovia rustica TaxID=2762237 RepID=A0ABR8RSX8_9CELL|nr:hypothetical protein [Oerskovia rustica]MBD7950834.1 hypothetical protein [Oerskovia rustica]
MTRATWWSSATCGRARTITPAVAVCMLGVAVLAGCEAGEPQRLRVEWVLLAQDGTDLEVAVFAGGSTCIDVDEVEVDESTGTVEVRAFVQRTRGACSEDFGVRPTTVALEEPLGDRELVGCAGDAVQVKGWGLAADTDCTETKPGLVPGTIEVPVG